jgi:hypothetical protein
VASGKAIGGPHRGPGNFCYYLGQVDRTCDTVCSDLGGTNLAAQVDSLWANGCTAPGSGDLSTWFYDNGNPGGWSTQGGTAVFHTLGYGYASGSYFGKCSTATLEAGAYPGETTTAATRSLVCACF